MLPPCHEKFHKSVGLKKFMSIFLLFSIIVLVLLLRGTFRKVCKLSCDTVATTSHKNLLKISPTQLGKSNFEILSMIFFKALSSCALALNLD